MYFNKDYIKPCEVGGGLIIESANDWTLATSIYNNTSRNYSSTKKINLNILFKSSWAALTIFLFNNYSAFVYVILFVFMAFYLAYKGILAFSSSVLSVACFLKSEHSYWIYWRTDSLVESKS